MEQTETRTMHTPGPWTAVEANASLIAAAPDLAAACRDMDENWHLIHDELKRVFADHNNPNYQTLVRVINEMQDAARAALAKAGLK